MVETLVPELLAIVLIASLIGVGIWYATAEQVLFEVAVEGEEVRSSRGTAPQPFLAEIREVCTRHNVRSAKIRGVPYRKRIALRFSADLPAAAQQQLRNWWANSGWSSR